MPAHTKPRVFVSAHNGLVADWRSQRIAAIPEKEFNLCWQFFARIQFSHSRCAAAWSGLSAARRSFLEPANLLNSFHHALPDTATPGLVPVLHGMHNNPCFHHLRC
jgi:hypothetical protein